MGKQDSLETLKASLKVTASGQRCNSQAEISGKEVSGILPFPGQC